MTVFRWNSVADIPRLPSIAWESLSPGGELVLLAEQQGMPLGPYLQNKLLAEPASRYGGLSGLSMASMAVGDVINGNGRAGYLFSLGADGLESPNVTDFKALHNLLDDAQYQVFIRMLQDVCYPRKDEPGYLTVPAREPAHARTVIEHMIGENAVMGTADFCDLGEELFVDLLHTPQKSLASETLYPIVQQAEIVGYQKKEGDHTVLLARPIMLNGVRIEPGALMTVEGDEKQGYAFGYGRMSIFGCKTMQETVRYHARNVRDSLLNESILEARKTPSAQYNFRRLARLPYVHPAELRELSDEEEECLDAAFGIMHAAINELTYIHRDSPDHVRRWHQTTRRIHEARREAILKFDRETVDAYTVHYLTRVWHTLSGYSSEQSYYTSS